MTGDASREHELGDAKWREPARSLAEVRSMMDDVPVRELDMDDGGFPWGWIALGAVLLLLVVAWFAFWPNNESPSSTSAITATEAQPLAPQVMVQSDPEGGLISLDGTSLGTAPVLVPVPLDAERHKLCVEFEDEEVCKKLTGRDLVQRDPYVVHLRR